MNEPGKDNKNTFGNFLQSNIDVNADTIDCLVRHCRRIEVKRGDFLLRQGMTCHHAFFVEHGLLKEYAVDDRGRTNILLFAPENWFLCNVETLFFHSPSNFFIEAVEDTSVLLIDADTLELLRHTYPAFADFQQQLLHAHVRDMERRVSQLMGVSAEERYIDFLKRQTKLAARLPQTEIASYLGVAPESLSRIRKELAERRCQPKKKL